MQSEHSATSELNHFYSLSDKTATQFMSVFPDALASALTPGTEGDPRTSPRHINLLTDGVTCVLHSTLDTVAPLKKRRRKQKTENTHPMVD